MKVSFSRCCCAATFGSLWIGLVLSAIGPAQSAEPQRPNVLFIAIDDLNHWVGYAGRNPQSKTPNIDRLSKMGVSFTRAYCAAPLCNPSRAALMSGKRPSTTACYQNADNWKEYIPEGIGLAATFKNAGYYVVGAGKIYHSSTCYPGEWEDYFDEKGFGSEDDEEVRAARARSKSMGKLEGFHTEVTHDLKDSDLSDWHIVDYCVDQLRKPHDKPFFLACGVHKPHLPWVVPGLTEPDTLCDRTVDFMSIYPTLCELAGISVPSHVEGVSIRRLLEDSQAPWDQPGVTTFGYVNHAVRSEAWRYIRYSGGGEEFYDEARDPYEWTNRADSAEFERQKAELGKFMPTVNTPARGKSKAKAISPDAKAKQKKANK